MSGIIGVGFEKGTLEIPTEILAKNSIEWKNRNNLSSANTPFISYDYLIQIRAKLTVKNLTSNELIFGTKKFSILRTNLGKKS